MTKTVSRIKLNESNISISYSVNVFLTSIFVLNVVFLPNDTFNLKIITLLFLLLINIPICFNPKTHVDKLIIFFGFFLTSFTIIWSILLTNDLSNISLGYAGYILLLYPIIKTHKINFRKIFLFILNLMAYFTVIMAVLDLLHIVPMETNQLLMWFNTSSNAMIGKGSHLPIYYMIFFKTSPLLFFALLESLYSGKKFRFVVLFISILLSGTRANILILIAVTIIYLCFFHKNTRLRHAFMLLFVCAVIVLLIDGRVLGLIYDMFARKSSSDAVRAGHIQGLLEYWRHNPINFIVGSGFSSQFYSYGVNEMTSSIELSYWNLLRQVGLLFFIPMMNMYLYPVFKLIKFRNQRHLILAYLAYLVISYTNPFLYSSTGLVAVLFMYYTYGRLKLAKNMNIKQI